MPSLDETFHELLAHLRQPTALSPANSDPVFYFVHDPAETLEVKRRIPSFAAALAHDGLKVETVSFSTLLWQVVEASGRWDEWLTLEPEADPEDLNAAVRSVLRDGGALVDAVAALVSQEKPRTVVFLTDTLALHPYFRVRTLESALHDRVRVPVVIFYPGRRSGLYGLRFLGFYPEDGNYRSTLVGGVE